MKEVTYTAYESVEIVCPKNPKHRLTVILDENYCEAGACLRVICKECAEGYDFGLRGELGDWNKVIKEFQEIHKKESVPTHTKKGGR